jgi:hypothetical protein
VEREDMKYWGYKHISGSIHLKRFIGNFAKEAVDEAYNSDFVEDVVDPFEAKTRKEASEKLKEHFVRGKEN